MFLSEPLWSTLQLLDTHLCGEREETELPVHPGYKVYGDFIRQKITRYRRLHRLVADTSPCSPGMV